MESVRAAGLADDLACGESPNDANSSVAPEAPKHSEASPAETLRPLFEKDVPGTSERACVNVNRFLDDEGRAEAARPGGFVAGNFPDYVAQWEPNPQYYKIWWAPLHTGEMPGVKVKATCSTSLLPDALTGFQA